MFSTKNASHLLVHKDLNYFINLVNNKQPHYSHIHNLLKNMLSIFWAYIDKKLTNKFIKLFKSLANASIFFVLKLNRRLQLCVDYQSFKNLIIKN